LHLITHNDTHLVGLPRTMDRSFAEISTCKPEHSQETNIHAPKGLEPTISASEQPQIHALARAVTGIGCPCIYYNNNNINNNNNIY